MQASRPRHTLAALLAAALLPASASATLIAFDPFSSTTSSANADPATGYYLSNVDGTSGSLQAAGNLVTQGGPMVGFGQYDWYSRAGTTTFRVQLPNLDTDLRLPAVIPDDRNDGGVRVLNFKGSTGGASSSDRAIARQFNDFDPVGTYYMSAVANVWTAAAPGEGGYFYLGFGDSLIDSLNVFQGVQWGFRTNATNDGLDLVLRSANSDRTSIGETVLLSNVSMQTNYFVVVKAEIDTSGNDVLTAWVNPAYSTSDPVGGIVISNSNAFTGNDQLTHFGSLTSLLVHSGGNNSTNRIGYFDSIALGTTYAAVVPEPAAYALLLGLAALGLTVARRRR